MGYKEVIINRKGNRGVLHTQYLIIDNENNLHVTIPYAGGENIGLENTCKSGEAYKRFTAPKTGALEELRQYKNILEEEMISILLTEDAEQNPLLPIQQNLFKQTECYIRLMEISCPESSNSRLPSFMIDFLKKGNNLHAVSLSPPKPDPITRCRPRKVEDRGL